MAGAEASTKTTSAPPKDDATDKPTTATAGASATALSKASGGTGGAGGAKAASGTAGDDAASSGAGAAAAAPTAGKGGAPSAAPATGAGGAAAGAPAAKPVSMAAGSGGAGGTAGGAGSAGAAGMQAAAGSAGSSMSMGTTSTPDACTREKLTEAMNQFLAALDAHDPALLPLAPDARSTEDAKVVKPGEGLWKKPGKIAFKRYGLDVDNCAVLIEAVLSNAAAAASPADPRAYSMFSVRLKLSAGKITELEAVLVPEWVSLDGASYPQGLLELEPDNATWHASIPEKERNTREELTSIAEQYLKSMGERAQVPIGNPCRQQYNGIVLDSCETLPAPRTAGGGPTKDRRVAVVDVEAGVVGGYGITVGSALTMVLLKVERGKVRFIDANYGAAAESTGWSAL